MALSLVSFHRGFWEPLCVDSQAVVAPVALLRGWEKEILQGIAHAPLKVIGVFQRSKGRVEATAQALQRVPEG